MKKVLFLAIAALTYAGAANAQTAGALPAAAADITLYTAGVVDALGNTIRTTEGGTYSFSLTSTNWNTALSVSDYTLYLNGSTVKMSATSGASFAETSKGSNVTSSIPYTGPAANDVLTFTETAYDLSNATMCTPTDLTVNVTALPVQDATVTLDKKAFCLNSIAPTIAIDFTNNSIPTQFTFELVGPDAGSSVAAAAYHSTGDIATWNLATIGTWATTGKKAGNYTINITNIFDEVGAEASNVSSIYGTADFGTASVHKTFVILPNPTPTLKSSAIR